MARGLEQFPELGRKYGAQILLAIIFLAIAIVLIRQRMAGSVQKADMARDELTGARNLVSSIGNLNTEMLETGMQSPAKLHEMIMGRAQQANDAIGEVLKIDDRAVQAQAWVARGDLNWQLANVPPLPGSTTQPSLQMDTTEYLGKAEAAYRQVINQFADQNLAVASARFGLAAIDETQHKWGEAADQYDLILADKTAPRAFHDQAETRRTELAKLKQPLWLATPTTRPATAPVAASPAQPAKTPATATTAPAKR